MERLALMSGTWAVAIWRTGSPARRTCASFGNMVRSCSSEMDEDSRAHFLPLHTPFLYSIPPRRSTGRMCSQTRSSLPHHQVNIHPSGFRPSPQSNAFPQTTSHSVHMLIAKQPHMQHRIHTPVIWICILPTSVQGERLFQCWSADSLGRIDWVHRHRAEPKELA